MITKEDIFFLVIYTHLLHATQMTDRHDIVLEGLFAAVLYSDGVLLCERVILMALEQTDFSTLYA